MKSSSSSPFSACSSPSSRWPSARSSGGSRTGPGRTAPAGSAFCSRSPTGSRMLTQGGHRAARRRSRPALPRPGRAHRLLPRHFGRDSVRPPPRAGRAWTPRSSISSPPAPPPSWPSSWPDGPAGTSSPFWRRCAPWPSSSATSCRCCLSVVPVVMLATGTLSATGVVAAQSGWSWDIIPRWVVFTRACGAAGFVIFIVSALAESNRSPLRRLPEGGE